MPASKARKIERLGRIGNNPQEAGGGIGLTLVPDPETLYSASLDTPVGKITAICSNRGLRALETGWDHASRKVRKIGENRGFRSRAPRPVEVGSLKTPGANYARRTVRELRDYFSGKLRDLNIPLDMQGTPFQRSVWQALLTIPYGETRSYADVARLIGHPRASRAVGGANGSNPVSIIVPCHRVIASDGKLGGYGGGLDRKTVLLELEQSRPAR